jgi:hypothetical protein
MPVKPVVLLKDLSQKALAVNKAMENKPKMVFYTTKPTAGPPPISSKSQNPAPASATP